MSDVGDLIGETVASSYDGIGSLILVVLGSFIVTAGAIGAAVYFYFK